MTNFTTLYQYRLQFFCQTTTQLTTRFFVCVLIDKNEICRITVGSDSDLGRAKSRRGPVLSYQRNREEVFY